MENIMKNIIKFKLFKNNFAIISLQSIAKCNKKYYFILPDIYLLVFIFNEVLFWSSLSEIWCLDIVYATKWALKYSCTPFKAHIRIKKNVYKYICILQKWKEYTFLLSGNFLLSLYQQCLKYGQCCELHIDVAHVKRT